MKQIETHIVLISSQAVPNFTPVLDKRFKPQRVIMLVSPDMQESSGALKRIYQPRGIEVVKWQINDPWDIEHIGDRVMDLLTHYPSGQIALNATGGTKPMSIAAYEVFRGLDLPIFYIHPEKDRLIWLHPKQPSVDLADRIRLREYLEVYGASEVNFNHKQGVPRKLQKLTEQIIQRIENYANALSTLNYLAFKADNRDLSTAIHNSYRDNQPIRELLELFARAGQCELKGGRLQFPDENARFFANGGWLEMYTYGLCQKIYRQAALQDLACSVEIARRQGRKIVLNEIDIGMLKDNRLYMIECKTKRYKGQNIRHDEGADVLYKLDSIRDLVGGLQTRAMLVSFNKINKYNRVRARELNIELCCYTELKNLKEKLYEWVSKQH